ncbi:6044_t:CDS:2 [Funneliformis geosporum]|uniref:6044_t:CDS:1 n=1 Tax=Funneliformis geosporum TaxID=1117311 RepID=A0A9W4SEY9_9GLOM|nr:6044_t:CDS:2 [Funneliformis geosporum]
MARPSKRKIKVKKQERNNNGTFTKKSRIVDNRKEEDYWGDEENSGWDEIDLPNEDENKKRGPYLTGTTKKSNFDKYRPSGSFTKAAKGTSNILTLINKQSNPDDFDEVVNDVENEHNDQLNLKERIESLRIELKTKQNSLSPTGDTIKLTPSKISLYNFTESLVFLVSMQITCEDST